MALGKLKRLRGRARARWDEPLRDDDNDPYRRRIAYTIALVSIALAVVPWQASVAVEEAVDARRQAVSDQVRKAQLRENGIAQVRADLRLLPQFEASFQHSERLFTAALAQTDPELARQLAREAILETGQWSLMARYFGAIPRFGGEEPLIYDAEFRERQVLNADPRFSTLRPGRQRDQAEDAYARSVSYTRAAAGLAAALLFFTLAELTGSSRRRRDGWVAVGVLAILIVVTEALIG